MSLDKDEGIKDWQLILVVLFICLTFAFSAMMPAFVPPPDKRLMIAESMPARRACGYAPHYIDQKTDALYMMK